MLLKIFAIRDSKAEFYNQPFYQHTRLEAERTFSALANDSKSTIAQHPEDYDLYHLGEYDNISGKIKVLDTPEHIVKAANLIRSPSMVQTLN